MGVRGLVARAGVGGGGGGGGRGDAEGRTGVATRGGGVGLMFQDHALFPHRDVSGNVEFGLRVAGMPADQRSHRVARALEMVGLEGFGGRRGHPLFVGGAPRVALARTGVRRPPLPRFLYRPGPAQSLPDAGAAAPWPTART